MEITTVGLDLAKRVFQVHAVDASGNVVVRKALRRAQVLPFFAKLPVCLVGIEACGTSHHWARELIGATALVRYARSRPETASPHFIALLARKPVRVATVAMANKTAHIV